MKQPATTENTAANSSAARTDAARVSSSGLLTVPNALCAVRLLGSPLLVVLAWWEQPNWCLGLFVFLLLTDWLDGKLAIWLRQATTFGARLDSCADAVFYFCTLLAGSWLHWEQFQQEALWIGAAVASYLASLGAGWLKFGRLPVYHTRLAKTSWLLIGIAIVVIFAGGSVWPLRLALAAVFLTNVEATIITFVLPHWQPNVLSIFHALGRRDKRTGPGAEGDGPGQA